VTGSKAPLPTVMEGELERGWEEVKLLAFGAMCEVAPESRNHSEGGQHREQCLIVRDIRRWRWQLRNTRGRKRYHGAPAK
jgi:hypothetical protein